MLELSYRPLMPLAQLQDDLNGVFEKAIGASSNVFPSNSTYPVVNLWEHGDSATLEAKLPGILMKDIEILVTGNQLTLKMHRPLPQHARDTAQHWHRRERIFGNFSRTISLPWELATDKVEATLKDGILKVNLPKSEASKPRKIKLVTN